MVIDRDTKRLQKKAERDRRVEEVYGRYPELAELDRQLRDVGVRLLKWAVSKAGEEAATPLNEERAVLARAREELLARLNIAPAVFEVQWDCPQCQDRGWSGFGEKCACLVQEEIDDLFASSGLTGEMLAQTFATFDLSWYQGQSARLGEKMAQVLALGQNFVDQVLQGVSRQNLLFYGG
ncbi:MAG: hypothetical protein PHU78_04605, partial [Heliobacteriaceae bacterium]|nr:hypothetical protein [Heliobacteriaceae bacterium]